MRIRDVAIEMLCARGVTSARLQAGTSSAHVIGAPPGEAAWIMEWVAHAIAAVVIGPSSFLCDMLSTALLVAGAPWLETLSDRFPGYTGWVAESRT